MPIAFRALGVAREALIAAIAGAWNGGGGARIANKPACMIRTLFEAERTRSEQGRTGKDDRGRMKTQFF